MLIEVVSAVVTVNMIVLVGTTVNELRFHRVSDGRPPTARSIDWGVPNVPVTLRV